MGSLGVLWVMSCFLGATGCRGVVNCCLNLDIKFLWWLRLLKRQWFVCLSFIGLRSRRLGPVIKPVGDEWSCIPNFLNWKRIWFISVATINNFLQWNKIFFFIYSPNLKLMSHVIATGIRSERTISQSLSCNIMVTGRKEMLTHKH